MTTLPLIRDTNPGLYAVCTAANTGYTIVIPAGARGAVLWFENAGAMVGGRVGMDEASTTVTGITGTDNKLGYHPPMPVEYEFKQRAVRAGGVSGYERDAFIHVASSTAGAVVRGMWLFASDDV